MPNTNEPVANDTALERSFLVLAMEQYERNRHRVPKIKEKALGRHKHPETSKLFNTQPQWIWLEDLEKSLRICKTSWKKENYLSQEAKKTQKI